MDKLKRTRPTLKTNLLGKHLEPIVLLAFTEDNCVVEHLKEYLLRTKPSRNGIMAKLS